VITGFNTDVEHDGVIYHVQTEDKGLKTPLILSLVYAGGAILASKRTPYKDLIAEGFNEELLAERLKRQHTLICAAIRAGRVDDLKQMTSREPATDKSQKSEHPTPEEAATEAAEFLFVSNAQDEPLPVSPTQAESPAFEIVSNAQDEPVATSASEPAEEDQTPQDIGEPPVPPPPRFTPEAEAYVVFDSRRQTQNVANETEEGMCVSFLEEQEFRSGASLNLGILVTQRTASEEKPLSGVNVSVKVLGTTFRPVIVSLKTQRDGVAMVKTEIPRFSAGRAAILVRAVKGEDAVEIRRVVHPG
jgi:hypothetical protein